MNQTSKISAQQKRAWLLWKLNPELPCAVVARAILLPHPIDARKISDLLQRIVSSNPVLGWQFSCDQPERIEQSPVYPQLHVFDTRPGELFQTLLNNVCLKLSRKPFDLTRDCSLRTALVRDDGQTGLVIVAHSIIADTPSLDLILQNIVHALNHGGDHAGVADTRFIDFLEKENTRPFANRDGSVVILQELKKNNFNLDLPTDRVRPKAMTHNGDFTASEVPRLLIAKMIDSAPQLGVSTQAFYIAALSILLSRYSRQEDILIGLETDPRSVYKMDRLIAPLSVVSVVQVHIDPAMKFSELALQAHTQLEALLTQQPVDIGDLVEALHIIPDTSRSPLVQVVVRFEEPVNFQRLSVSTSVADVDLTFSVRHDGASVLTEFASDIFDTATVERLNRHWFTVLSAIVNDPYRSAASIPMIDNDDEAVIHSGFNQQAIPPGSDTLLSLIDSAARRYPKAHAVHFQSEFITYEDLMERAERIARVLRSRTIGRDKCVAICMERSIDLIVGLVAIVRSGGAYVPIEPHNPVDRIEFILKDSKASIALTDSAHAEALQNMGLEVLVIDRPIADAPAAAPDNWQPPTPDSLVYVIYTSGSTGVPKGVLIEHRNVVRLFSSLQPWFQFSHQDIWTMFHSVAFDFSVWEIWGALIYGGCNVVVAQNITRAPEEFYRLVSTEHVTILNQTPSAFRQFAAAEQSVGDLPLSLRFIIFGGEALEFESLRPWFVRHGDFFPRLINMFGITETTVHATYRPVTLEDLDNLRGDSLIGKPITDLRVFLVDFHGQTAPIGVPGEIMVGGAGVARGYLNRPELTEQRFPISHFPEGGRLYRSGDLGRYLPSGDIEYLGRIDFQVKIRGFRIETGEIESILRKSGSVDDVAVLPKIRSNREVVLVAYVVTTSHADELRRLCREKLPEYMVPSFFISLPFLPMTVNGKIDRAALPDPHMAFQESSTSPDNEIEKKIADAWKEVLGVDHVGTHDNFFNVGGTSIAVVRLATLLRQRLGITFPVVSLFQHPTIAEFITSVVNGKEVASHRLVSPSPSKRSPSNEPIAVVGVAGRFPGADTIAQLWSNLINGVESITTFSEDTIDPQIKHLYKTQGYVPVRGILPHADMFDCKHFGFSLREAQATDPQQRVMLEVAWEALEDAGHDPARFKGAIGVFAGEYNVSYYTHNILTRPDFISAIGDFQTMLGNEKDFVASRIAYRLNLRGPALSIHTGCSTSLVAIIQAFYALGNGVCDMALAGATSISFPQNAGHFYENGAMLSVDGHTKTFDSQASGTVFSDGSGMVVLRRLADALADRDNIYAIIRGVGCNNDGGGKMSFTAPSSAGQSEAISMALRESAIEPTTIGYIETHGTATPLGDPIEIEGLKSAFKTAQHKLNFCGIGSIKSNVGHCTAAAGVAGLIKTALIVKYGCIPPTINFSSPNPELGIENSPFYIVDTLTSWPDELLPRRAGVSSFGVGGTNAHVLLEEAPPQPCTLSIKPCVLLVLSATTETALTNGAQRLSRFFSKTPDVVMGDAAFTLQTGRRELKMRRYVVAKDRLEAAGLLLEPASPIPARRQHAELVFMFPGQGSHYLGMGKGLYENEPFFKMVFDRCNALASSLIGKDLRSLCFSPEPASYALLETTRFLQPALFCIEYSLSKLLDHWGIAPAVMVGHSLGEFVAACLAGIFSLEDGLKLVTLRAALMEELPKGVMLSVRGSLDTIMPLINNGMDVAAVNSASLCVLSGDDKSAKMVEKILTKNEIPCKLLHTAHAFHSRFVDPIIPRFVEIVKSIRLSEPNKCIISSVTGVELSGIDAKDPLYWAHHARRTVQFADAIQAAWVRPDRILIEVGPRTGCTIFARQVMKDSREQVAIPCLSDSSGGDSEIRSLFNAVGRLWAEGITVDFEALSKGCQRIALPTYAFDRTSCFVEPGNALPPSPQADFANSNLSDSHAPFDMGSLIERQISVMNEQLSALTSNDREP